MIYEGEYFVGSALNGDSLSHHGIPGQRKGVKNGPPYPIKRGHDIHYNVGKMTPVTRKKLEDAGKIAKKGVSAVGNAAKTVVKKTSSSFQSWKNAKKEDLVTKETDSTLLKNWQKKQLRISDMSNQELQQRIDRKKLEEGYKRALRGDFSDPKTWNKSSKDAKSGKGELAAKNILQKVGTAAVDGLAKGITAKISDSMTAKAKAKIARKEARKDAIASVMADAAKQRAQYKADKRNEAWKVKQEEKEKKRKERQASGDGALDAIVGDPVYNPRPHNFSYGSYYAPTSSTGIVPSYRSATDYYYSDPDEYRIR